jgi:uncharacterized protein (DUF885 family)
VARDASVLTAVRKELAPLPEDVRAGGLAASALTLAKRLDEASPRDAANIARELRTTLAELRTLANAAPEEDDPIAAIQNRRPDSNT